MTLPIRTAGLAALATIALVVLPASAQQEREIVRLAADPEAITLEAGETTTLDITAYDAAGNVVEAPLRYAAPVTALRVEDGRLTALQAGDHQLVAMVRPAPGITWAEGRPPSVRIPVTVTWPAVSEVRIEGEEGLRLYAGTTVQHRATPLHADGSERPDAEVRWSTSDRSIATVDRWGAVTAHRPGRVSVFAEVDGTRGEVPYEIAEFTATRLDISAPSDIRTGDVIPVDAVAMNGSGARVRDLPITWSVTFVPDDTIGHNTGASGTVRNGRFVAEIPGRYTILASSGSLNARHAVDVRPREVQRSIREVGHGRVDNVHSSDMWVWRAADGRDYAISGTWGGDGIAYVWDVSDPANMVKTDSVQVDARTINDVKVSPDGRYAVLPREGASDRRNGAVILDLADPAHPVIATEYDEGLTGGVHNSFPDDDYLYVLSAGEKYLILDMEDIYEPRYVGEYHHPGARIHDVHVHDGIAYSSQWAAGVIVVDVGNGRWGGSPESPVFVRAIKTPGGRTHTTFPYQSQSTDRFYLVVGDEILNRAGMAYEGGLSTDPYDPETGEGGVPSASAGYIHIIDFTGYDDPRLVARYQVPEFGTHNMWIVDDVLYQGYYEGGLRIVDFSGELMGNLAEQQREIAVAKPHDPVGFIANAPMVWTAHPHQGRVFLSDFNSGVWAYEVEGGLVPRDHCHRLNQEYRCR